MVAESEVFMSANLPKKLGKEPLIDVVCAVTFDADVSAESLLPGLLLPRLGKRNFRFEQLPASQIPQAIRDSDQNLKNAPLMKIFIDDRFVVLIGSNTLAVGCLMPYVGWAVFKNEIEKVFRVLGDADFVKGVVRHSLKYVDFLRIPGMEGSLSCFNLTVKIAGRELSAEPTHLRTEIKDGPFLHATSLFSQATVTGNNEELVDGAVADVDTHRLQKISIEDFLQDLSVYLEEIHSANKKFFFALLSDDGLKKLEPIYD